jgi:hypothetical protein
MAGDSSPDYKALFLKEIELRKQAEGRNQPTTFSEFIRACHSLLSGSLKVETPCRSTQGTTLPQTGKYCPTRLRLWKDCQLDNRHYHAVRSYLQLAEQDAPQLLLLESRWKIFVDGLVISR